MEIFGIGPFEILLVVVLALIVMGPEDMVKNARRLGQGLRKLIRSDFWRDLVGTTQEIRSLPKKLIQETGLEEDVKDIKQTTQQLTAEVRQTTLDMNAGIKELTKTASNEVAAVKQDLKAAAAPEAPAVQPQPTNLDRDFTTEGTEDTEKK